MLAISGGKKEREEHTSKRPLVAWSFLSRSHYWNTNSGSIDIIAGTFEGSDGHRRSPRESDMMRRGRTRESTLGTYCQFQVGNVLK